jgi:hypothetical protein
MAKQIYTPVRLEPLAIPAPYDRIQATDLLEWEGQVEHAGFQNLLRRVDELLPAPVTRVGAMQRWGRTHAWTIMALAFALAATWLLVSANRDLSKQLAAQAATAAEVQRLVHRLDAVAVTARVRIAPEAPGVREFVDHVRRAVFEEGGTGPAAVRKALPDGVVPNVYPHQKEQFILVERRAALWPDAVVGKIFMTAMIRVGLSRESPGDRGVVVPDAVDLTLDLTPPQSATLELTLPGYEVSMVFSGREHYDSLLPTGKIISIGDLETARLSAVFYQTMEANHLHIEWLTLLAMGRLCRVQPGSGVLRQDDVRAYAVSLNGTCSASGS